MTTAKAIEAIQGLVTKVVAQPEITAEWLETTLGVALPRRTDVNEDRWYEADLPSGPFDHALLRLPSKPDQHFLIVGFRVRQGVDLALQTMLRAAQLYRASAAPASPHGTERTTTYTLVDAASGRAIRYIFEDSPDRLRTISIGLK